jgi:hypothetical protein
MNTISKSGNFFKTKQHLAFAYICFNLRPQFFQFSASLRSEPVSSKKKSYKVSPAEDCSRLSNISLDSQLSFVQFAKAAAGHYRPALPAKSLSTAPVFYGVPPLFAILVLLSIFFSHLTLDRAYCNRTAQ